MRIVYRDVLALNSDTGEETYPLTLSHAWLHQVAVSSAEVSGTVIVKARPMGMTGVKKTLGTLDLSDATLQLAVYEGLFDELYVEPSGIAADSDYTVAIAGAAF